MTKEFTVSTTCPECGLIATATHDEQTMRTSFGNNPTLTVVCTRCQASYEQAMDLACAEWDDYCMEIPLPADV